MEHSYARVNQFKSCTGQDGIMMSYVYYEASNPPVKRLKFIRRVNGGAWQETEIASRSTDRDDMDEPYCLQVPFMTGGCSRIACVFRDHTYTTTTPKAYSDYRITIYSSENDGASFAYLSTPLAWSINSPKFFGLWSPFLKLIGTSGRLIAGWSENTDDIDRNIVLWYHNSYGTRDVNSPSGGWFYLNTAIGGDYGYTNDSYPAAASIDMSKLIVVADEKLNNQRSRIQYAISNNNGVNWPSSSVLYQPPAGKGAANPQIIIVGGILVVGYMTDGLRTGTTTTTEDGADFVVQTSYDNGITWGVPKVIAAGARFPSLLAIDNTKFWAVWGSIPDNGLVAQQHVLSG